MSDLLLLLKLRMKHTHKTVKSILKYIKTGYYSLHAQFSYALNLEAVQR